MPTLALGRVKTSINEQQQISSFESKIPKVSPRIAEKVDKPRGRGQTPPLKKAQTQRGEQQTSST